MSLPDAWRKRCAALIGRAVSGARWAPLMSAQFGDEAAGAAAARWIGIESGGNPLAATRLNERGLAQVMKSSAKELGITDAMFAEMSDKATTDKRHAELAAKVIAATTQAGIRAAGFGDKAPAGWGAMGIGLGKLRHALPLMLREVAAQGLITPEMGETVRAVAARYRPTAKAMSFAAGAHALTGSPRHDLVLRFMAPAAVVAFGEAALLQRFDSGGVS